MNKNLIVALLGIALYSVSAVISFFVFSGNAKVVVMPPSGVEQKTAKTAGNDYQALVFDQSQPKTEACPLNGAKYSTQQKDWWEKHRPLGVMIENHLDARPQSGISFADVVYESVAEGGITRFLAVYYCQDAGIVGPVRSARTYFLDYISEYADYPLYAHVGGANTSGPADALGQIDGYGWGQYNDLNQFSIGFPTFWRDENRLGHEVATEHTMYSTTTKLWDIGAKRGLTNVDKKGNKWDTDFVPYSFKEDAPLAQRPESQAVTVPFWDDASYQVDWTYDKAGNNYLRKNGSKDHVDRNTNKQLSTKNLVILLMRESRANDGYEGNLHMLYGDKGAGNAKIFMDGKEILGTWKKKDRTGRTLLYDNTGAEIKFNRGTIWFEIQPTDAKIVVK